MSDNWPRRPEPGQDGLAALTEQGEALLAEWGRVDG